MSEVEDRDRLRVSAMIQALEEAKRDSAGGKADFLQPGLAQKAALDPGSRGTQDSVALVEATRTATLLPKVDQ